MIYNYAIKNTINDLVEQTNCLGKAYGRLNVPLKERSVILLTDDKAAAQKYISLFADAKLFTNSSDFEDSLYSDKLYSGKRPLVLISSLKLPIHNTGFSKALFENYEGATVAGKIRASVAYARHLRDRDLPIILFGQSLDNDQSHHVESIADMGPLALFIGDRCHDPRKEEIESILSDVEHDYFKRHFEPLFKAALSFNKTYALTKNGQ